MRVLEVYIEHAASDLDRPFSYAYLGDKKVQRGYRVIVPFNNQTQVIGFVSAVIESPLSITEYELENGFVLKEIIDVLDEEQLLNDDLWDLALYMTSYYFTPLIKVLKTMLPPSLKPQTSALKAPKIAYDYYVECVDASEEGLTSKQIEWLRLVSQEKRIPKKDFKSSTILEKLCLLNKVKIVKEEKRRLILPLKPSSIPHQLTADQSRVIKEFLSSSQEVSLLEGVTGSGKTEVYARLIEHYLQIGKNVLFLVPEIALTPMMIDYFSSRFHMKTAILHSALTSGQKYDEYRRIAHGEAQLVIGARSAIFAPLDNIGLIILDEEHVESYKQDHSPCYHALEIAKQRAKKFHSRVLLGSATPSLESRARALKGVYQYLSLPHRINDKGLPKTEIIDLLKPSQVDRESVLFSLSLRKAISDCLARHEQVILLLNRRGYSSYVTCRHCGHVFVCPECQITLSYHRYDNMLKCHHCDYVENMPSTCPKCGSVYLSKQGFGTERIEDEVRRLFKDAKVLRLDSDVARVKSNTEKILDKFRHHEADILIGTQMIAKGHDFPDVTLVGFVLADIGLTMPSFRSSERTFQLITQGIGRAGRLDKMGRAIIQTYMPNHYAVVLAAKQDYTSFFKKEMQTRKLQQYPPYTYLISLCFSSINEDGLILLVKQIKDELETKLQDLATVVGPSTPYIAKKGDTYYRHILLKYKKAEIIEEVLNDLKKQFDGKSLYHLRIDRDPYDF